MFRKQVKSAGASATCGAARSTEITVDPNTTSRRTFLGLVGGGALAAGLAACGSSGPTTTPGSTAGGAAAGSGTTYWFLTGTPQQAIREAQVKRFNDANPDTKIKFTAFQ